MNDSILNIAAYKFVDIADPKQLRLGYKTFCRQLGLKGTIIFAPEGVNVMLAGDREQIAAIKAHFAADPRFDDLAYKESYSDRQPFTRMLVKAKQQIIPLGEPGDYDPRQLTADNLPAQEFKRWLDESREMLVLDVRNDYEVRLGTFEKAVDLALDNFRDFPQAVDDKLAEVAKDKPVVMFCTGGVRCEKASADLLRKGFSSVYQLQGGILEYFKQCGGEHYDGDCFVFDYRVALDPALQETDTVMCFCCLNPLTQAECASDAYEEGVSCPYCIDGKPEITVPKAMTKDASPTTVTEQ